MCYSPLSQKLEVKLNQKRVCKETFLESEWTITLNVQFKLILPMLISVLLVYYLPIGNHIILNIIYLIRCKLTFIKRSF